MLVEGISYYIAKSYAFEPAVQKHHFAEALARGIIGRKLFLIQHLRKFKSIRRLVEPAVHHFSCHPIKTSHPARNVFLHFFCKHWPRDHYAGTIWM